MMAAVSTSVTSVDLYKSAQFYLSEDSHHHTRRESMKSQLASSLKCLFVGLYLYYFFSADERQHHWEQFKGYQEWLGTRPTCVGPGVVAEVHCFRWVSARSLAAACGNREPAWIGAESKYRKWRHSLANSASHVTVTLLNQIHSLRPRVSMYGMRESGKCKPLTSSAIHPFRWFIRSSMRLPMDVWANSCTQLRIRVYWERPNWRNYLEITFNRRRVGQPGSDSRQGQEIFVLATASRLPLEPIQPPVQSVTACSFSGVKGDKAWSCPLTSTSAEVKNEWSCCCTSPHFFMALCLVKHQKELYLGILLKWFL
jgi:hypothetical protein